MIRLLKCAAVAALAVAAVAGPAFAHHSGAHFDAAKTVTVAGTVTDYLWTNPHATLKVAAADGSGQWEFELSSVNIIARHGWSSSSFKSGDKVTVSAKPARDGSKEGLLLTASGGAGAVLSDHQ